VHHGLDNVYSYMLCDVMAVNVAVSMQMEMFIEIFFFFIL